MTSQKATLIGLVAIVLWSTMVGLIRGVSEGLGPVGGAAMIYSLSGLLLIFTVGLPDIRRFPGRYLIAGSVLFVSYEICLALLLFEHVHAESRDRGQAMVDLLSQYETVGLQLNCRELPDHLPLYLEYLSVLPEAEAREGLQNIAPILALLGGRLKQRGVPWYQLFDALLTLAGSTLTSDSVTKQIVQESRDDTRQALDAVWEEEQVKFIEDNATTCDSSPLHHYQRRFSQDAAPQYVDVSAGGPK